jgi:hypothetical protein
MGGEQEASFQAEINIGGTNYEFPLGENFHENVAYLPMAPRIPPTTSARMVSWWISSGAWGLTGKGSGLGVKQFASVGVA